jgi:hypothetical protein
VTQPKDRLRSWREEPPKTPDEAATAELLQTLRSEAGLSPEALARVEQRVRAQARQAPRKPLFSRPAVWLVTGTTAAAGLAAMLLTFQRKDLSTATTELIPPAAEPRSQDVASKAEPPQVAAQPPPAAGITPPPVNGAPRGLVQERPAASKRRYAQPPPEEREEDRGVAEEPVQRTAKGEVANRAAKSMLAQPPAPSTMGARGAAMDSQLEAEEASPIARAEELASHNRCPEALPLFSAIRSDDPSTVERTLMGKARCYLALGKTAEARQNLQVYLSRFPEGRFAEEARDLLR